MSNSSHLSLIPALPLMEEVQNSPSVLNKAEKGIRTPLEDTQDDAHLSKVQGVQPPPMDGGINAWLFLAACFAIEALVWGFAFTYGVFQAYYSDIPQFKDGNIAVVGTCAMGIMYLDTPLTFAVYRQWPRYQRLGCGLGVFILCAALGLSSLATNTNHLIVTQGIFYAIGGSIAYAPCILLMEEWFDRRKGLAFGVMYAGTGLGGAVLPIVVEQLLGKYGFRITLRGFAVVLFILTGPLVYFVKPRVPIPASRPSPPPPNLRFLFTPAFALFGLCSTVQALGFFLPSIYLPTYTGITGASASLQALSLILFNSASVVGCVLMGAIVDKFDVTFCILVNTIGSSVAVFLIWGLSTSLAPLFIFSIVYGIFAGSYSISWPGIMRAVVHKTPSAESSMVYASLAAGRGIGSLVSGPLSEALIKGMPWKGDVGYGYGTGYGPLIVFIGVTSVVGGGSCLARRMKCL